MKLQRSAPALLALLACAGVAAADAVPIQLGSEGREAAAPRVASAPDGTAYLMWSEKTTAPPRPGLAAAEDLYLVRWPADAAAPSAPVRVNYTPGEAKSSVLIRAQLEVGDDGTVHVLYPASAQSPLNGKPVIDVRYVRSIDGGRTFSAPVNLNSPAPNDLTLSSHGSLAAAATFPALATGPDNRVFAFWLDSRHIADAEDPSDVYAAVSANGGVDWSADRRLFGGQVCECCQPVASRGADAVLLSSRQLDGQGHRDPIVSRVSFDLATVGAPARIGTQRWEIDGCPMKSTALAADGQRVYVAWYSQADAPAGVWFAVSEDGGRSFDDGRALHPGAEVSDAPVLAVARDGSVIVAWHAKTGSQRQIYVAESFDHGRSFSAVRAVSTAGESAGYPALALTPDQQLIAWQQGGRAYVLRMPLGRLRR